MAYSVPYRSGLAGPVNKVVRISSRTFPDWVIASFVRLLTALRNTKSLQRKITLVTIS
jgi:hypothetical protein